MDIPNITPYNLYSDTVFEHVRCLLDKVTLLSTQHHGDSQQALLRRLVALKARLYNAMDLFHLQGIQTSFLRPSGELPDIDTTTKSESVSSGGVDYKDVALFLEPKNIKDAIDFQKQYLEVRRVTTQHIKGDCEFMLIGQDGLFVKKHVPHNTCLGTFNGFILRSRADLQKHKYLSDQSGVGVHKYNTGLVVPYRPNDFMSNHGVIVGRGLFAKINASLTKDFYVDTARSNVRTCYSFARIDGQTTRVTFFYTTRDVNPGEELRWGYIPPDLQRD